MVKVVLAKYLLQRRAKVTRVSKGKANGNYRHDLYSREADTLKMKLAALLRQFRYLIEDIRSRSKRALKIHRPVDQ